MAINASLFVVPENKFEGLDKATNILMQQRKYAQDVAQEKQRNKTVDYKLLESSYDPKDYFTGTVYDGRIGELINGMMQKGRDLINQGVDYATMKGILAADANKLNQYSTKAKLLSAQKKEAAKLLADAGGVDMNRFSKAYDEEAYYETDPQTGEKKLKDINDVDETINYADQLLRNKPELVTDASGIDKFVKEQYKMPIKTSFDTNIYDAGGTLNRAKVTTKYANYLQPEYDNRGALVGYVPKYEQATDNGDKIYEGKNEVRLLDRNEFERLPANVLNHIKTLTKEHLNEYKDATGNKIDLGSYQAENLARAIAYKELNKRKSWDYENIEVKNKPSPQALTVRYGLNSSTANAPVIDVFKEINDAAEAKSSEDRIEGNKRILSKSVPLNELSATAQTTILNYAQGINKKYDANNKVFIRKENDGTVKIYDAKTATPITTITERDINIKVQPTAKGKTRVVETTTTKTPKKDPLGLGL